MTISPWEVYAVCQLDTIRGVSAALAVLGGLALALGVLSCGIEGKKGLGKTLKRTVLPLLLLVGLAIGTPSSRTAAAMIIVPRITDSEFMKRIPVDLMEIYEKGIANVLKNLSSND